MALGFSGALSRANHLIIGLQLNLVLPRTQVAILELEGKALVLRVGPGSHFNALDAFAVWVARMQALHEFCERESGVGIQVQSPDNASALQARGHVLVLPEKGLQVFPVNIPILPIVDETESQLEREGFGAGHALLQLLKDPVKSNFLFKEARERLLHLGLQGRVLVASVHTSLAHFGPQVSVVAGGKHLEQVFVEQVVSSGLCGKVLNQVGGVGLRGFVDVVAAKEIEDFLGGDSAVAVPVDALEGGLGLEVGQASQVLPLLFDGPLALAYGQQHPVEEQLVWDQEVSAFEGWLGRHFS